MLGHLGDRLLDKHVNVVLQEERRHLVMRGGRDRDAHRVDQPGQLAEVDRPVHAKSFADFACPVIILVGNGDDLRRRQFRVLLDVSGPETADADNARFDGPIHL